MTTRAIWIGLVVAAGYLASGAYVVANDERAVVRTFGRATGPYLPGLHWAPPWPLSRVDKPKTSDVRLLEVASSSNTDGGVLTGDTHVLDVVAGIQYQVIDPVAYVVATEEPEAFVTRALRGAVVETFGRASVDQALTTGRATLGRAVHERAQRQLDDAALGVLVVAVTLERLEAPDPVRPAFQDVASARKDAERRVDRARSEGESLVASAHGEATTALESAHGSKARITAEARGEAQRFTALLAEHRRAPEALEQRLLIETLEVVLPRMRTYVVDEDSRAPLKLVEPSDG